MKCIKSLGANYSFNILLASPISSDGLTDAKSRSAGLDLNCGSFLGQHTQAAVDAGLVDEAAIDKAVSNNFATLMRLGFFDGDPRKQPYGKLGPSDVCTPENQELAREAARQGIVLLKNSDGSLPLDPASIKTLAVIGPNANVTKTMIGNYEGKTTENHLKDFENVSKETHFVMKCASFGHFRYSLQVRHTPSGLNRVCFDHLRSGMRQRGLQHCPARRC